MEIFKGVLKDIPNIEDAVVIPADYGIDEIALSIYLAKVSIERGKAIGKSLGIEFLLWLNKTRQIHKAIKRRPKEGEVVYLIPLKKVSKKDALRYIDIKEEIRLDKITIDPERWESIESISLSRIKKK